MSAVPGDRINNAFYDELKDRWYNAKDDPVALLRAESRLRNPWVERRIRDVFGGSACSVLDLACGAGFLSNILAGAGHSVIGVDVSRESLEVARRHDSTESARYLEMDAHRTEFDDGHFDVVCAMDFLEHTSRPEQVIREAARLLRPGGLFFFHTFSRNFLSYLIVIKGVEWFVRNTPKDMHVHELFIKPAEIRGMLARAGLKDVELIGVKPKILTRAFFRMLSTGEVMDEFEFEFTRSTAMGYSGYARKRCRL